MNTLQSIQKKKKKTFAQVVLDPSSKEKISSNRNNHTETYHDAKKPKQPFHQIHRKVLTHTSTIQNTQKPNRTSKSAKQNKEQKLNLQHDNHSTLIHTNNFSLNSSNESLDHTSYSLSHSKWRKYYFSSGQYFFKLKLYRNLANKELNNGNQR